LRDLVAYWQHGYDWRAEERRLNAIPQITAQIDGIRIHAVHQRGTGPNPVPLLILHGWPSSFVQFLDLIPLLTDPASHGGDPDVSFDVIAASLPGYGFSGTTTDRPMSRRRMGDLLHRLMTDVLGYPQYAIRASDIGAGAQRQMALAHPGSIIGIHLTGIYVSLEPDDVTPEERAYLDAVARWNQDEGGYSHQQRTKPQTLAYGLNDSPTGLAAWMLEKFHAWSDGDIESLYGRDALLTNVALYWFTRTIGSSMRVYRDGYGSDTLTGIPDVPTAILHANEQIPNAPLSWARRLYRTDRVSNASRGGHFIEWEQPGIVAGDLRAFFRDLRD
jgi:pimeloyl-ACP methyl ester carboxylesterase